MALFVWFSAGLNDSCSSDSNCMGITDAVCDTTIQTCKIGKAFISCLYQTLDTFIYWNLALFVFACWIPMSIETILPCLIIFCGLLLTTASQSAMCPPNFKQYIQGHENKWSNEQLYNVEYNIIFELGWKCGILA